MNQRIQQYSAGEDSARGELSGTRKRVRVYSAFLAFLPIVSIYDSGIPGLNLGDVLLAVFSMLALVTPAPGIRNGHLRKCLPKLLIFPLYILTIPLCFCVLNNTHALGDVLIRTIRITFYFFCAGFTSGRLFDTALTGKWVVLISKASVLFIVAQYVSYYVFNTIVKGYLPWLHVYTSSYETLEYSLMYSQQFFRPTSFFLEPAHYCRYIIFGLIILLFSDTGVRQKGRLTAAVAFTVAIILSTSGLGLLLAFLVWGLFLVTIRKHRLSPRSSHALTTLIFVFPIVLIIIIQNTSVLQNTLSRVLVDNSLLKSGAVGARLGTFESVFSAGPLSILFGSGYGAVPYDNAWMSGITYVLFGAGITGLVILLALFVRLLRSKIPFVKIAAVVFLILFITDDSFNSYMSVFYLSLLLFDRELPAPGGEKAA